MTRTFIETLVFTERMTGRLDDEAFRELQKELMANPAKGKVIPGCGGLRKVRAGAAARGQGKRGGVRVLYLDTPAAGRIDLITLYGKDEQEVFSPSERKAVQAFVKALRAEALAARPRRVRPI